MVHSVNEYIPGARSGCGCAHNGTRLRASTPEMTEVNSTSNERLLKPEGPDRRIIDPYKHTLGLDDSGRISMSGPKTAAFHKHNAGTSFGGGPTEAKISFRSLPTSRVETRLTRTLLTRIQDPKLADRRWEGMQLVPLGLPPSFGPGVVTVMMRGASIINPGRSSSKVSSQVRCCDSS